MGVHIEHNGVVHDVGVRSTDLVSQFDDGVSDLLEVGEFDTLFLLGEFGPRLGALWLMVQTQLKGTSGHETVTSGEEVETDDGLEHRRFTCTLGTEHCDSGEFDEFLHAHISQVILASSTTSKHTCNSYWHKTNIS